MRGISNLVLLIALAAILSLEASAVNIMWSTKEVDFVPNQELIIEYAVQNGNDEDMGISIFFNGDLAQYMKAEPSSFPLRAKEYKKFIVTINFPAYIDKPGWHPQVISIKEERYRKTGTINVYAQVDQPLSINVPYEGKYLDGTLSTAGAKENQPITFTLSISNLGKTPIDSVYGTVRAYNGENSIIATANTGTALNLERGSPQELSTIISGIGIKPGKYWADAEMTYDKESKTTEKTEFRIGELKATINNYTSQGYIGKINKFTVYAESAWNDPISGVYADVVLKNGTLPAGKPLRTITENLAPWEIKPLQGYIDLADVSTGNYTAEITLSYAGRKEIISGNFEAIPEPVPEPEKKPLPGWAVASIIAAIVILINIVLWIILSKKKHGGQNAQ
jgi:hypothetical protein